jgi:hypothetical protein
MALPAGAGLYYHEVLHTMSGRPCRDASVCVFLGAILCTNGGGLGRVANGDGKEPLPETVILMEELVKQAIAKTVREADGVCVCVCVCGRRAHTRPPAMQLVDAYRASLLHGGSTVALDDITFALRKQPTLLARLTQLTSFKRRVCMHVCVCVI